MENNKNYEQFNALLNGLNDEQKKKVNKCKDVNEFMLLLGELGITLPDELLDNVSGGTQDEMEFINQLYLWDEVCRQRGIGVYDAIRREQVWRELFPNG